MCLVLRHPLDVCCGLLDGLIQSHCGRTETQTEIVLYEFLQLKKDKNKAQRVPFFSSKYPQGNVVCSVVVWATNLLQLKLCRKPLCDSQD